ncbi:MAG: hypothetical protein ACFCU2_03710 [Acidimicrobiia bacterium]
MLASDSAKNLKIDAPGATSTRLPSLGHTIWERPMHPTELDTPFTPEAVGYRRGLA